MEFHQYITTTGARHRDSEHKEQKWMEEYLLDEFLRRLQKRTSKKNSLSLVGLKKLIWKGLTLSLSMKITGKWIMELVRKTLIPFTCKWCWGYFKRQALCSYSRLQCIHRNCARNAWERRLCPKEFPSISPNRNFVQAYCGRNIFWYQLARFKGFR